MGTGVIRNKKQPHPKFEVLDHTADATIRAYGDTLAELLENAAYGMISLGYDPDSVSAERLLPLQVEAATPADLLMAWLKEILYLGETEGLAFALVQAEAIRSLGGFAAEGRVWGQPWADTVRRRGAVVKAITYHKLSVEERDGWRATVTFDV